MLQAKPERHSEIPESVDNGTSDSDVTAHYQRQLDKYQANHRTNRRTDAPVPAITTAVTSPLREADVKPWSGNINSDKFALPMADTVVTNIGK